MGGREETIELGSEVLDLWRVRAGLRVKLKGQGNLGGVFKQPDGGKGKQSSSKTPMQTSIPRDDWRKKGGPK